jgi:hypothetical protein
LINRNSPDWPHRSFQELISSEHLDLKLSEIDCLLPFADKLKVPKKIDTYQQLFRFKLDVRDSIRAKTARELGCGESRLSPTAIRAGGLNFKFVYQRMKVDLIEESAVRSIYRNLRVCKATESYGVFTTSCQAAIAALFHTLRLLLGEFTISVSDGAYWETLGFLNRFSFKVSHLKLTEIINSPVQRVIYLDSSTETTFFNKDWPETVQINKCRLLIVDTTCLSLSSERLSEIIEVSKKAGLICVFVRSHMKLDCLAMEYGRLGSIVFLWPSELSRKAKTFSEDLIKTFNEVAAFQGTFANLSQIYPFITDTRFQKVNELWQKRVQRNNKQVSEYLQKRVDFENASIALKKFEHEKYFWFITKRATPDKKVLDLCRALDRNLSFLKVPHLSIASYPWDFLSITPFKRSQTILVDQKNRTVIRISVPDFEKTKIDDIKKSLLFWTSQVQRILE